MPTALRPLGNHLLLLLVTAIVPLSAHPNHDGSTALAAPLDFTTGQEIIGHNSLRYRVNREWSQADRAIAPVTNAHAMIEDREGQIYLVTDDMANAFIVYEKDGTFVRSFGSELKGGHGVDLITVDGEELLIHVDSGWHQTKPSAWEWERTNGGITLLRKDGTIVRRLPSPHDLGIFTADERYQPCDVAVTPDNDILIVDGYATDRVLQFKPDGTLVRVWGGHHPGDPGHLQNAHGISIDTSNPAQPKVWVSSREENKLKAFTLEGEWLETIDLPGAFAGQAFFAGGKLYTGVCWSKENGDGERLPESGFVLVLDQANHRVLSAPGGTEPTYVDDVLQPMHQALPLFTHVHDLYVDSSGDIYVGEWNSGNRYPYKLELIHE
jgi:hypothetical protein